MKNQNSYFDQAATPGKLLGPAVVLLVLVAFASGATGQTITAIRGTVQDAQGGALPAVAVQLHHAPSGLERQTFTDASGRFEIANIPLGPHDLAFALSGFTPQVRRVDTSTGAAVDVTVTLDIAPLNDAVSVTPFSASVDDTSGGTRHAVSAMRIERIPVAVSSRGLEAVLVSFPGFAQNANGAIHPRGAHNQMTFVVDGLPISDQLTGAFANALDVAVVQTAEVLTGHIPAEFGGKVSGVAVLGSRSGLGTGRGLSGSVSASVGGFGTAQSSVQVGGERGRVGYFGSVTAMRTDRFLDQVSLDNLHNGGRFVRGFGRADVRLGDTSQFRVHAMGGRSRFELANLRSQHAAGQDQQQGLGDFSAWATYQRTSSASSTFDVTSGYRLTTATLTPSASDTPVTASQHRRLSTYTITGVYTRQFGRHLLRAGGGAQHFPVEERFTMGITSAVFNAPDADAYNDALAPYDLTRGGAPFVFDAVQAGNQAGVFLQSTIAAGAATLNLGLRYDEYHFLVSGRQLQPRLGVAYRVPGRAVVLRASYNRNYQTPPNENLLLSNSEAASRLAPASVRDALGGAYRPIQPERQDVLEAGVQLAVGRGVTFDSAVFRKRSLDQQDNNNFFDTGIIFPTTLARIDVTGLEMRLSLLPRRGWSGSISATTGRAISSPPFTGGLFLGQEAIDLLSAGPFAIDHDQRLGIHGLLTFDPQGPLWLSGSVRYDSGLVSNPSDPATVAANPDFADLLPYVNLDAAVPRVRPRTIADVAVGYDGVDGRGRRTWGAQVQVTNVTNQVALYNFQSVFVGTRLVQPRTVSLRVSRAF